ncbi:MAG: hypothetical protein HYX69_22505 [Planctomycetia bacterium]|nr:hypothetical protein [Planctomycetia bacterium]
MSHANESTPMRHIVPPFRPWRQRLVVWGLVALGCLLVVVLTWRQFFVYVPPGRHLVVIANNGESLPEGQVLAEEGQKGILSEVQGEGWHFVMPVIYSREVEENTVVPPGKVGIKTARGGRPLPPGRLLAEPGEQGIERKVVPPGSYRVNRYGYDVELVPATDIKPGFVGVLRRLLGKDGQGRFADGDEEKGILRQVLQPGLYYINTKEYEVVPSEVGIFQTTFFYDEKPARNTAITFVSKGGFQISMDCTVEWEIRPEEMPSLVAEYGSRQAIERNVIDVQAHAIGRDKGIDYGVQNFLEGTKREEFQRDFTTELTRVCKEKDVTVHSAFIRNIVIPETYLKPIREKQIAAETEITNKAKEATAQSEADVEREQRMIPQREAEVQAETKRLVAGIDREVENIGIRTETEIDKMNAEYQAQIASLDAQRTQTLGEAQAQVTRLVETAKSSLYQLKMQVFGNDGEAFLKYSLAQELNPAMVVRLFQSGPGTFWTNMDGKGLNFMLPAGGAQPAAKATGDQKPGK